MSRVTGSVKLFARSAASVEPVGDRDGIAVDEAARKESLEIDADGCIAADADAAREAAAAGASTRLIVEKSCDLVAAGMGWVDSRID